MTPDEHLVRSSLLPWLMLTVACLWGFPTGVRAQGAATASTFTLEEVVEAAKNANAQLRSLASMREAIEQRSAQEGALPNPMFAVKGMDDLENYEFPPQETRFELEQPLPWFGKQGLRSKVAESEARAAGLELQAMQREVIYRVKETYFELFAVQQAQSITNAEQDLLQQMEEVALAKYAVAEVSQQDVLKAQAELSMLEARLIELEEQAVALRAKLNQLLNRPDNSPLGRATYAPVPEVTPSAEALAAWALRSRPEISLAQVQIEGDVARSNLMSKEFWPDYRLGVEYRSLRDGPDMLMFSVGFDLPLWRSKYRSGVREMEYMVESGRSALQEVQRQTAYDVRASLAKLSAARQTVILYQSALIPQAEARFAASEAGYRAGGADFLDLLESERFLLDARLMAVMAEGRLGVSFAQLERAVGADLAAAPAESGTVDPGSEE